MNRAFFFDIDGTIYRQSVGITSATIHALERLRKQGDYVFLSTGRTTPSIEAEFPRLPYDGYVGGNGSLVILHGRPILNIPLDEEVLREIIDLSRADERQFVLEGDRELYSDDRECCCELFDYSFYEKLLSDRMRPVDVSPRHVNKLAILEGGRPFQLEHYAPILDRIKAVFHPGNCVEIGPRHCNKATGCAILLQSLGISRKNAYAFGDSRNDIEILQYVGHGIGMGDACPEVIDCVEFVTGSVENDGVSMALEQMEVWD